MSIQSLIRQLSSLHELEAQLNSGEETALKYLNTLSIESDPRLEGLLTLIQSLTALRRLVHLQLREFLVDQSQHPSKSVLESLDAKILSPNPTLSITDTPEREPLIPDQKAENEGGDHHEALTMAPDESRPSEKSAPAPRVEVPQPTPRPLQTSGAFGSHGISSSRDQRIQTYAYSEEDDSDLDLDALAREVHSLTQPVFDEVDFDPSLFEETGEFMEDDLKRAVEVLERDQDQPPPVQDLEDDFSALFPESAGEAGTALLDADEIERYKQVDQQRLHSVVSSNTSSTLRSPIRTQLKTPHTQFIGEITEIGIKDLFIQTNERLLVGEHVELTFSLPSDTEEINCLAMIRERVEDPALYSQIGLKLRFLNLRPSQEQAIMLMLN